MIRSERVHCTSGNAVTVILDTHGTGNVQMAIGDEDADVQAVVRSVGIEQARSIAGSLQRAIDDIARSMAD